MATRMTNKWRLFAAAGILAVVAGIWGNPAVALAQPRRALPKAKAANVRIDMDRLTRPRRSDASKYIYISRTEMSDFDLGAGGVSHQKWEDVWVVPLRYAGEDGEFFFFREQISDAPWSWAFAKRGVNNRYRILVKTHTPSAVWEEYDSTAIQERRYQPR